ncbi:Ger(x)C family spore germination protein [Paenibacillus glucanolyticus]|uniref:Ger(x)C family spore germination protein n=1 Tax=Paenibacillus glucanolyticus TaxID=59843 RepID=UPI00096C0371|nr:Ger(x)C family spore germination protein [Paenibacillus glucanolyticus]OMF78019.1 spore gernimation protein GerC [Paenibacillus glucanolyticus]
MTLLKLFKILLPLILLTGCGFSLTKVEINEQTFVFAMYINEGKQKGTVEVTISAPLPNRLTSGRQAGGHGGGDPYAMVTKTSTTVQDTLHLIQRDLSRRFDFSHTKVVVVGKGYAEAGLEDLMDWLQREPTTNLRTYLMVAPGDAKKVAELTPVFEQMPSEVLIRFATQHNMINTTLKDCLYAESANQGYALTYLAAQKKPMVADQEKLEPWTGIQGTAIFHNHKLLTTLPMQESLAVSWAVNEVKGPLYTVSWDEGAGRASVFLISTNSKKSVRMVSGHPVFTIKLLGIGDVIYKRNLKQLDTLKAKRIIERELNDMVKSELQKALRTSQRVGSDILQLGMLVDWNYPDHWEKVRSEWANYYKNEVEIQVVTDIRVRNFGTTLKMKPK